MPTINDVRTLNQSERQKIVAELKQPRNHRLYTMFILIGHTGLRISEALKLDIQDIYNFETHQVRRELYIHKSKTKGRAGKRRSACLSLNSRDDKCRSTLEQHLAALKKLHGNLTPDQPLFMTSNGTRWKRTNSSHLLDKACDRAGVERFGWHVLRKSYGTEVFERSGHDLEMASAVLRHKSTEVTRRYLGHGIDRLHEINAHI